jgi:hypothetical protein
MQSAVALHTEHATIDMRVFNPQTTHHALSTTARWQTPSTAILEYYCITQVTGSKMARMRATRSDAFSSSFFARWQKFG